MKLERKKKTDYVNNADFLKAIVDYISKIKEAESQDKPKPIMPRYIGECIKELCTRMSFRGNFIGYTRHWKEEMVSDAIMNCFAAVENFNVDKSTNPFGYFSRISWNAFLHRIAEEKQHQYVKHKNLENMSLLVDTTNQNLVSTDIEAHNSIIRQFEEKLNDNKKAMEKNSKTSVGSNV